MLSSGSSTSDELIEFVVTVKTTDLLDSFYEDMETPGGDLYIPNRAVGVYMRRPTSQNTHYMLTQAEAVALRLDPRVVAVNPADLIRSSRKLTRIVTGVTESGTVVYDKSSFTANLDAQSTNWGLLRSTRGSQIANWGDNGNARITTGQTIGNVSIAPTLNQGDSVVIDKSGKNVDVVIVDGISGVPEHPEFAVNVDGTGGSRYVQFNWHDLNSIAHSLDNDNAQLLADDYSYAGANDPGNANHGTHTSGTVAGNNQGWASDANIYQIDPVSGTIDPLIIWDYIRAFHATKPINPDTGRRNPTICNCSYGSSFTFPLSGTDNGFGPIIEATRRGVKIGDYTQNTPLTTTQLINSGIFYVNTNQVTIPILWVDEDYDVKQAIADGIIVVGAAGNESQYIDNYGGIDYLNELVFTYNGTPYLLNYNQGTAPGAVKGAICVGAVSGDKEEHKGWYSNTGPRIDVFAPGTWIVSSVADSIGEDYGTVPDVRNTDYYLGRSQGTSMATPQVTGLLACILEAYPRMTPKLAKKYLSYYSKSNQLTDTGGTTPTWVADVNSLQGAKNKYLFMPKERQSRGLMYPKKNSWIRVPSATTVVTQTGGSITFNGSGQYLQVGSNAGGGGSSVGGSLKFQKSLRSSAFIYSPAGAANPNTWTFIHSLTSDWTIEAWLFFSTTPSSSNANNYTSQTLLANAIGSSQVGFCIDFGNANAGGGTGGCSVQIYNGTPGSISQWNTGANEFVAGNWYHFAFSFVTSTKTGSMYKNGVRIVTGVALMPGSPAQPTLASAMLLGSASTTVNRESTFDGYITNLRITTTALYTGTTITVPALNLANVAGTKLLLNVVSDAAKLSDSSSGNVTVLSGTYDGINHTPAYNASRPAVTTVVGSDWTFLHNGLQNYTIECWFNASTNSYQALMGTAAYTGYRGMEFSINGNDAGTGGILVGFNKGVAGAGNNSLTATSPGVVQPNSWNHIAVTFVASGKQVNIFLNGKLQNTRVISGTTAPASYAFSAAAPTNTLLIGYAGQGSGYFNGYMNNIRISKSILYTIDFTPTIPLAIGTDTFLLLLSNTSSNKTSDLIRSTYIVDVGTGYSNSGPSIVAATSSGSQGNALKFAGDTNIATIVQAVQDLQNLYDAGNYSGNDVTQALATINNWRQYLKDTGNIADWNFLHNGTSSWTIEMWFRTDSADPQWLTGTMPINQWTARTTTVNQSSSGIYVGLNHPYDYISGQNNSSPGSIFIGVWPNGIGWTGVDSPWGAWTDPDSFEIGKWNHLAITFTKAVPNYLPGYRLTIYVNGFREDQWTYASYSSSLPDATMEAASKLWLADDGTVPTFVTSGLGGGYVPNIRQFQSENYIEPFKGSILDFRITKSVVYPNNFDVPTTQLTILSNTVFLINNTVSNLLANITPITYTTPSSYGVTQIAYSPLIEATGNSTIISAANYVGPADAFITSGSGSGPTDDGYVRCNSTNGLLPFTVKYLGDNYTEIDINTNGYVTFGENSGSTIYNGLSASVPSSPKIFFGAGDRATYNLTRSLTGVAGSRILSFYQIGGVDFHYPDAQNYAWAVRFYEATPDQIDMSMPSTPYDGIYGVYTATSLAYEFPVASGRFTHRLSAVAGTTVTILRQGLDNNGNVSVQFGSLPYSGTTSYTPAIPVSSSTNFLTFNGLNSYITIGNAADWKFLHNGQQDWTFECWFYNVNSGLQPLFATAFSSGHSGIEIVLNNYVPGIGGASVFFDRGVGGGLQTAPSTPPGAFPLDQWNHIAVTFTTANKATQPVKIYANGVAQTLTNTGSESVAGFAFSSADPSNTLTIGRELTYNTYWQGYMTNIRVVKSVVYTGDFAVPTTQLGTEQTAGVNIAAFTRDKLSLLIRNDMNTVSRDVTISAPWPQLVNNVLSAASGSSIFSGASTQNIFNFPGAGQYLSMYNTYTWGLLSRELNSFTFEMWIYPTSYSGPKGHGRMIFSNGAESGLDTDGYCLIINSNGILRGMARSGGVYYCSYPSSSTAVPLNAWSHVAFTRLWNSNPSQTTYNVWLNGVKNTVNSPPSYNKGNPQQSARMGNPNFPIYIGHESFNNGQWNDDFAGYMTSIRFTESQCYLTNFTPSFPNFPSPDGWDPYVKLLLRNGISIDASNAFAGNAQPITNNGINGSYVTVISTPLNQVPCNVLTFNNTTTASKYLTVANDGSRFQFGSGDFTIECWLYRTVQVASGVESHIINCWNTVNTRRSFFVDMVGGATISNPIINLGFSVNGATGSGSSVNASATWSGFTLNTWHHLAIVRVAGFTKMYFDGAQQATTDTVGLKANFSTTDPIGIGAYWNGAASTAITGWQGYLIDIRIIKGVGVYTGNFILPKSHLTATQIAGTNIAASTSTNTKLLIRDSISDTSSFAGNIVNYGVTLGSLACPFVTSSFPFSPFLPVAADAGQYTVSSGASVNGRIYPRPRKYLKG